ncbi:unnamed protein product [Owenia fusiformis]|uniref:Uncharacterized protein n=1 Tax=Owenia fusiformis TaxID=6347 RepID=A0A8J1TG06_OWEFU|nr:unnamed protein product [Owenia fusiformis]
MASSKVTCRVIIAWILIPMAAVFQGLICVQFQPEDWTDNLWPLNIDKDAEMFELLNEYYSNDSLENRETVIINYLMLHIYPSDKDYKHCSENKIPGHLPFYEKYKTLPDGTFTHSQTNTFGIRENAIGKLKLVMIPENAMDIYNCFTRSNKDVIKPTDVDYEYCKNNSLLVGKYNWTTQEYHMIWDDLETNDRIQFRSIPRKFELTSDTYKEIVYSWLTGGRMSYPSFQLFNDKYDVSTVLHYNTELWNALKCQNSSIAKTSRLNLYKLLSGKWKPANIISHPVYVANICLSSQDYVFINSKDMTTDIVAPDAAWTLSYQYTGYFEDEANPFGSTPRVEYLFRHHNSTKFKVLKKGQKYTKLPNNKLESSFTIHRVSKENEGEYMALFLDLMSQRWKTSPPL